MKYNFIRILGCTAASFIMSFCANSDSKEEAITNKKITASVAKKEIVLPSLVPEKLLLNDEFKLEKKWVDSIYYRMSVEEKIGQLYMVAANSNKDDLNTQKVDSLVQKYNVGGVIFFQGGPISQAKLTNHFQSIAKVPLFIAIDAEWGLSMRLDSTYRYPWNMTLGAIQNLKLIEKVGEHMGKESKRMGIHFNFAPVLDINTNPLNPIIGNRSFGESKENVAEKAIALMKGAQGQGVYSTGKHFPGHGDTSTDSHKTLPTIAFSKNRIELVELYPFKKMFNAGLASVMVGHLNIPSLESRPDYPSSLSYNVVTNLLQKKLEFKGLIFTDALVMKGASNAMETGDIDLAAFMAGNDILLCPENVPLGIEKIKAAFAKGTISEARLAHSVKKILSYKYRAGLNQPKQVEISNLYEDLNKPDNDALQYQLYENAITVLDNKNEILPLKNLDQKIAYVKLGDDDNSTYLSTLKKYTEITEVSAANVTDLNAKLKEFNTVIVGFHKSDLPWKNHDFTATELVWLQEIAKNNTTILNVFTKPYSLLAVTDFSNIEGLVVSYQNSAISQVVSAEVIFGAIKAKGKLPVSINLDYKIHAGLNTKKLDRLGFTAPQNEGMNPMILKQIDAYAKKAIDGEMTPGAQVVVARNGKVIYQKSYGYHTYERNTRVTNTDLYDLASITKMLATLPNVMQLYDQKKVNLNSKLSEMLPYFSNTNKKDIVFKNLLSHYAGLKSWIPFYIPTLSNTKSPSDKYYSKKYDAQHIRQVADGVFIRNDYHDTIMKIIADSPLYEKKEYKYSDLTFILLKEYVERANQKKLENLVQDKFYKSLGMNYTLFNPLQRFDKNTVVPTEIDTYYRQQTLQGYVHDMGAAMEGGVAGHAGLFSNAMDVAKMMQLYLQKGSYGDKRYFSAKTFNDFNHCYFCGEEVHRGLGFDKRTEKDGPTCGCVSSSSFGHTGFTGNIAWADPKTQIVYVFLSNRTYPKIVTNSLARENIREDIQQVIQNAIIK
ncbi:glycoside hydrolase family 3 N-terminal domain-containing protein [Flavobacterium algicola]|uniref:glycoside hydrolase family 3 N-terminal domain-containing protein n=1 Tax=Flavobacterium algicola TaxID=556529 RepID=UPI001EFCA1F8|nr:glycoside hydrolase family 3 N-terminal domain-containing protein [Flavobacterium algicola]MCG9791839.1 serine hydrolase [Flavobacterium algicola]